MFHPAIAVCFALSGLTSLTFEILWVRMLTTSVFGASHMAVATVISVFMGGMALGSWLGGKLADRSRNPALLYGLAEGCIGLYGLLFPLLLKAAPAMHRALWAGLSESFYSYSLARFFITCVVLLVPTTLMGATLPLLAGHVTSRAVDAGRKTGFLYSVNTLGAAFGVLFGGFFLLPSFGLSTSNMFAAGVDMAVCAVVIFLYKKGVLDAREGPSDRLLDMLHPERRDLHRREVESLPSWVVKLVLYSFGLGGFSAMVYQVVWTRTLVLAFGSSVYAFNLILLAFILGLGLGGLYFTARRVDRLKNGIAYLGRVHLAIGISAFAGSLYLDSLPLAVLELVRSGRVHVGHLLLSEFGLTCLVILVPTFCMGAAFPIVIRLSTSRDERVGTSVGRVYAANTFGSILGAFSAAFLMLPTIGARWTIAFALFVNLGVAAILSAAGAIVTTTIRSTARIQVGAAAACSIAVLLAPSWDVSRLTSGLFRVYLAHEVYGDRNWSPPKEILYLKHSTSCTVSVERLEGGFLALKVNGKTDASSTADMPTQVLVSVIPLLLHKDPRDVAIIGYGSGATVGAALRFPVESVLAVELEEAVVEAAEFFADYTWRPREDPRLKILYDDGRNVLSSDRRKFDVIVSEPSNPWITGVSNLFTVDYFTIAKKRLKPGGVFCQWLQMYELSPKNIKIIARTFASCFDHVLLFVSEPESTDAIMVGSDEPLRLDLSRLEAAFGDEEIVQALEKAEVEQPEDLLSLFLLGDGELPALLGQGPVNTDDNMLIEFSAPRDMLQYGRYREFALELYYRDSLEKDLLRYVDGLPHSGPKRGDELTKIAESLLEHGRFVAAGQIAAEAMSMTANEGAERANLMSMLFLKEDNRPPAIEWPKPGTNKGDVYALLRTYVESGRYPEALAEARSLVAKGYDGFDMSFLMGFLLYACDDFEEASDLLSEVVRRYPGESERRPEVYYYLARAYGWRAKNRKAVAWMKRFLDAGFK